MTTIERMARAIYPTMAFANDFNAVGFLDFDSELAESPDSFVIECCYVAARAALQAIRVPDEAMTNAGTDAAGLAQGASTSYVAATSFTAVIDAILAEKPEGGA